MRHAPIKQGNASQEHFRSLLGFGGSDAPEPNSPLTVAPARRGRGPDRGSGARDRAHSDQHDDARATDRVHEQQAQAHRRQERHPRAQEVDAHQVPEAQVGGRGHHSGGGGADTTGGATRRAVTTRGATCRALYARWTPGCRFLTASCTASLFISLGAKPGPGHCDDVTLSRTTHGGATDFTCGTLCS